MLARPLVSIVVNNHNYGRFLRDAIGGALGQSYARVETVVVDDGSTDDSRAVIAEFAGRIVPVLKENGGQASAFDAGFAAAHGEIVIFLDADDVLLPHAVERVVAAFRAHPEVVKVMYRMRVIDAAGVPTGAVKPPRHLSLPSGDIRGQVLAFPYDIPWAATSGNAFRRDVLARLLPVPTSAYGRVGADWYLSHLSSLHGQVLFVEEICASYRIHGVNSYEPTSIDAARIRATINYMRLTNEYIAATARQLGLPDGPARAEGIQSVSYVANRLVSLKLDPANHPIADDTVWRILRDGLLAISRRFDASVTLKVMYLLWLLAVAASPLLLARRLAELFFFPETRPELNAVLSRLHDGDRLRAAQAEAHAHAAEHHQQKGTVRS